MEIKLKIDFWKFFNEFRNYHALPRYIQISRCPGHKVESINAAFGHSCFDNWTTPCEFTRGRRSRKVVLTYNSSERWQHVWKYDLFCKGVRWWKVQ